MKNINNEEHIVAYKGQTFTEYVAQRNADALLWRRCFAVFLAGTFICAVAALALSYNG